MIYVFNISTLLESVWSGEIPLDIVLLAKNHKLTRMEFMYIFSLEGLSTSMALL